jgi:hypothetical protein
MGHSEYDPGANERRPWNAGRKLGGKRPLKPQQVWAIRFWLDREHRLRDRAMFDFAIDSKLRGCDVVKVKIGDLISCSSLNLILQTVPFWRWSVRCVMIFRQRSFFPSQGGRRQAMFASASCRSTSGLDGTSPRCSS